MPIPMNISQQPGVGNLGRLHPSAADYSSLSNLVAAFIASAGTTQAGGNVVDWAADGGTLGGIAHFVPDGGSQPHLTTREGLGILQFNRAQNDILKLQGHTIGNPTTYSIGMRVYITSSTDDFQDIIGDNDFNPNRTRLIYRNTANRLQFQGANSLNLDGFGGVGWHSIIMAWGGGQKKLAINGGSFVTGSEAAAYFGNLRIGSSTVGGLSGANVEYRSLLLFNSDLQTQSGNLAATWSFLSAT